ncbi:DUF6127 family protein [Parasphingopyxis lamellibrachiae]|uniref:Uncharacterized protein n=1 Tax=Parasphingopyxis lamellibrachiae TaxID=680125 RepID=A0A3D9FE06_9SPHN|nr:DUF6127 family protein [Parasphingopyxis lamellibrachiae]RED16050.1 hypothetical protein DFR46_1061 [Parasphingopyxis lamellibrachiae]
MSENEEMLARLVAQLADQGSDLVTVRAIIEEASELGATHALHKLGLSDTHARRDLDELRELLGAWRIARRGAIRSAFGWIGKGLLALILLGLAVRFGVVDWLGR